MKTLAPQTLYVFKEQYNVSENAGVGVCGCLREKKMKREEGREKYNDRNHFKFI